MMSNLSELSSVKTNMLLKTYMAIAIERIDGATNRIVVGYIEAISKTTCYWQLLYSWPGFLRESMSCG